MLPVGGTKRKSDQISTCGEEQHAAVGMGQQISTAGGSPHDQEGPFKKRRLGITPAQKQALIDNLRLEITERARKLRANYNIHAQSLRTRIEIRVNRIPMSLRKLTMGELLQKYATEQQQKPAPLAGSLRGPPLLAKDPVPARQPVQRGAPTTAAASTRPAKRPSHEISGGDKENVQLIGTPNKKIRGHRDVSRNPGQVLSPTTSNSRVTPRERTVATPSRSSAARPVGTPNRTAAVATNMPSSSVAEKTRSARVAAPPTTTTTARNAATATSSTAASSSTNHSGNTATAAGATAASRKRGATVTAAVAAPPAAHPPPRPATRTARRASGNSESSEASTSTVVRKRPATAPPGAAPKPPQAQSAAAGKRSVMGTTKKAVAGTATTKKAPATGKGAAATATAASTAGTGRALRKRA